MSNEEPLGIFSVLRYKVLEVLRGMSVESNGHVRKNKNSSLQSYYELSFHNKHSTYQANPLTEQHASFTIIFCWFKSYRMSNQVFCVFFQSGIDSPERTYFPDKL